MAFVIDSLSWNFNGLDVGHVTEKLEGLLARLDASTERKEEFYFGSNLQQQIVCGDMDLWSFLYSDLMQDLDNSIITELASYLNTGKYYEDEYDIWPHGFPEYDVYDINGNTVSLDYSFVHFNNVTGTPFACISLNKTSTIYLLSEQNRSSLFFITNEDEHKIFWRTIALTTLRDTQRNLEMISSHCYPNLYFHKGVWKGIDDFRGGYAAVYDKLQQYLSVLDDYGFWAFKAPPPNINPQDPVPDNIDPLLSPTNQLIQNRFSALGITVTPEKPEVKANKNCREAREINIGTKTLYCEWHGKLELHKNRIHIYPPIEESNGKVIIAIFHDHLALP